MPKGESISLLKSLSAGRTDTSRRTKQASAWSALRQPWTNPSSPRPLPTPPNPRRAICSTRLRASHTPVDACLQLENFLLKRLKKDSVHVKLKVLRVIKHCCQHGHATFRREMQRHTTDIKECLSACCTAFPPARLAAGDAGKR